MTLAPSPRPFRAALPLLMLGLLAAAQAAAPPLRVEGHKVFTARRLSELAAVPDPGADWSREEWASWAEDAALLVREAYRDRGHFDALVDVVPRHDLSDPPGAPPRSVGMLVYEGPRYRFGEVRVSLPDPRYPAHDARGLATRTGRGFDRAALFRDRRDLLAFYGNAGFLRAQASESLYVDPGRREVDVAFRVVPGDAFVFDTLLFRVEREGDATDAPGGTRHSVLRNLFPARRGDTLSLADINAYERKLKSTRVFNFVRLRDSTELIGSRGIMTLSAEERVPGEVEAAGYWETQYGLGADLSLSHANLAGRMQEGRAGFTLAQRKQSVLAGYASPLLFGTLVRFDNELVANWYQDRFLVRDTGWFDGDFDVSNQSKFSRQLTPWARAVSGAEIFGKSERIDAESRTREFNLNFLNSAYLQRLDTWINPGSGARLALTWGNGGPLLDVPRSRHNWFEAEAAAYVPLRSLAVLAFRLDGGRFFGEGGINSSRFFLGGPRSVRSRDWRSVCPRVNAEGNCVPDVEPAYILGSAEVRLQPFQSLVLPAQLASLQVVPFADLGNSWEVGRPVSPSGEGRAVGLGIRYPLLGLFNVRVDYARDPGDAGQSRWIFDLAQAF